MDLILDKKDVVKTAVRDWDAKRAPAIQQYARSLSNKIARDAVTETYEMFKGAYFLAKLMLTI